MVHTFVDMLQCCKHGVANHCLYPNPTGVLEGVHNKIIVYVYCLVNLEFLIAPESFENSSRPPAECVRGRQRLDFSLEDRLFFEGTVVLRLTERLMFGKYGKREVQIEGCLA
jgi:hypothetical protein